MIRVLVVDDSIDKFDDVSKSLIIKGISTKIDSVEDTKGAMDFLKIHKVDLLIVDQQIPVIKGTTEVIKNGGELLVKEIERKSKTIKIPNFIIGLTQFDDNVYFSDIWKQLIYSPSKTDWSISLKKIIKHIDTVSSDSMVRQIKELSKPTVFLEGLTDLSYFNKVIELNQEMKGDYVLKSQNNAGANWVAQQLIIWGHTLPKTELKENLMSIGVFDNDTAGIKSKHDAINKLNTPNQKRHSKIYSLPPKHSEQTKKFYSKSLHIELEIETFLPLKILEFADNQGWLENRSPIFITPPKDWDQMDENVSEFLERKGLNANEKLYLKKVKLNKKQTFANYVLKEADKDKTILDDMKSILKDITNKLLK